MERVCIYARVSSIQGENQDYQRQIIELKQVCKASGFEDEQIDVYAEKVSGYKETIDRPELNKLLLKIDEEPNYYKLILVSEISRIARKPAVAKELLIRFSRIKQNVYIHSHRMYTMNPDGSENNFVSIMLSIAIEFADIEAKQLKQRMTSGKFQKVTQEGRISGNNQAYGYMGDENKKFVINPNEALTVLQIFNSYKDGIGMLTIANTLNQQKIPTRSSTAELQKEITKARKKHLELNHELDTFDVEATKASIIKNGYKNQNLQWDENVIRQILMNETYKGKRTFKEKTFDCPAIIDVDLFDTCTDIRINKVDKTNLLTYEYLLKDLMYCGCCGKKYVATFGTTIKAMKAYRCYSTTSKACGNKSLNINLVESIIYDQLIKSDEMLKYLDSPNKILNDVKVELEQLEQQLLNEQNNLSIKENELERLIQLTISSTPNKYSAKIFKDNENKIITQIENATNKIEIINRNIFDKKKLIKNFNVAQISTNMIVKAKENRTELTTIFKQYINKIIVNTLNKDYTLITAYYNLNGIPAPQTIKTIINVAQNRNPKKIELRKYQYMLIVKMINDPVFKNNIMMIDNQDILDEYFSNVEKFKYELDFYKSTGERMQQHLPVLIDVPKDNLILIENTYPITNK